MSIRFLDLDRTLLMSLLLFAWNLERLILGFQNSGGTKVWLYYLGTRLRVRLTTCLDGDPHKWGPTFFARAPRRHLLFVRYNYGQEEQRTCPMHSVRSFFHNDCRHATG